MTTDKKGTISLPIDININTPEKIYNKNKILQGRKEIEKIHQETRSIVENNKKSKTRKIL